MSPLTRVNGEPLNLAPPAVATGDDGPDQASVQFGDKDGAGIMIQQDSEVDCIVSEDRLGLGSAIHRLAAGYQASAELLCERADCIPKSFGVRAVGEQ